MATRTIIGQPRVGVTEAAYRQYGE
ncbi:hypothetical protein SMALA_2358 [Streptomyces malaysiensis subsp. malaysiensis]|nr:hypothetical protein SMALA_2358 [Streptomyces malaysiensis]